MKCVNNYHALQASQPEIYRSWYRTHTNSLSASTNVDTGRKVQSNLQYGTQQANLDTDLSRYPHLTTSDEHRPQHATEGVSIHNSYGEGGSSRGDRAKWPNTKPDHVDRNRSSRDSRAPGKRNKDHRANKVTSSKSKKHWTEEGKDTLESILTEVKREKHTEKKKRLRKKIRRWPRCSRIKSSERQDISSSAWDTTTASRSSYMVKCSASRESGRVYKQSTPSHSYTSYTDSRRHRDRESKRSESDGSLGTQADVSSGDRRTTK